MTEIYLNLPWAPAYGSYYSQTRRGKYITKKGNSFRSAVINECIEQNAYGLNLESPICFSVILYPPDKRTRDLDNHLKALQDALTHAKVWDDDSAILQMHVYKGVIVKNGNIIVKIEEGTMSVPHLIDLEKVWDIIES